MPHVLAHTYHGPCITASSGILLVFHICFLFPELIASHLSLLNFLLLILQHFSYLLRLVLNSSPAL